MHVSEQRTVNSEQKNPVVEIRKIVHVVLPRIPFEKIARTTLGRRYRLSLVICGDSLARKMNRTYREKSYAANVLSFPLAKNEGEIFLNAQAARREAKEYDVSLKERLTLLFVHACLHLKGVRHGKKMDASERNLLRKFL